MKMSKRTRMIFCIFCAIVLTFAFATTAFADDDPIAVVNNLSDFIFGFIRAIGIILLGFGILQLGLSLKSRKTPALRSLPLVWRRHPEMNP